MTDTEGTQNVGGGEQPTPQPSQQPEDQQPFNVTQTDWEAAQNTINQLQATVRTLQSGKDQGISKANKRIDEVFGRLDTYDKYLSQGMSNTEARRQMQIDELLQDRYPQGDSTQVQPGATGNQPEAAQPTEPNQDPAAELVMGMAAELETEMGVALDPNDPEVSKFELDKEGIPPYKWLRQYEQALNEKKQRSGAPPDQGVGSPPGRAPSNLGGGGTPTSPVSQTMDPTELLKIARQQGKF